MSNAGQKPRILCVDDEPAVLEGIKLVLRGEYEVHTANSADEGLRKLREQSFSVVVSDMRMPGKDGATFLQEVRYAHPSVARLLLTGEAGRDAAALAVNKGQILHFLTKPCKATELKSAIEAGVVHSRLMNAERMVLQETLIGCIHALVDVLALANPLAFGRASRVQQMSVQFANVAGLEGCWQLEAAATLSQIAYVALPAPLLEKVYHGDRLTEGESRQVRSVSEVAMRLVEHVPRLEPVVQILVALDWNDEAVARLGNGTVGLSARILGVALEYDVLMAQGHASEMALQILRTRSARYGDDLLDKFAAHVGAAASNSDVRELPLGTVSTGMILLQDIRSDSGTLLASRGYRVTDMFRECITNFDEKLLHARVRVLIPAG